MKGKEKNMIEVRTIIHRLRMGESKRQIHRDLKVHRSTIREIHSLAISEGWLNQELPMPGDEEISKFWKPKNSSHSHPLDIHKELLAQWDREGISSIVIQRLLKGMQCSCDVQSIRRYRKKHFSKPPKPIMVRTTTPGKEMEVDFGELGKFLDDEGVEKKVWLFSLRLRHSGKAYREIVLDQTSRTFLMGHVHAFEYFGGVPRVCVPDNTKTAVVRSTIDNDMINRSYLALAEHYHFVIQPCRPRTPEHKGGVEGDVKYVKRNFIPYFRAQQKLSGVDTPKICDLVEAFRTWVVEVADIHIIHGVGRSPSELFNSEEAALLQSIPKSRWEFRSWQQCEVKRDWRVMIDCGYYSVPYRLIGETVNACVTHSLVRIFFNHEEVAIHERATKKWEYKRKPEHAPPFQEAVLQCTREGLLALAEDLGTYTYKLSYEILSNPIVDKLKPVRCLLRLGEKHSNERLEKACERAYNYKTYSYMSVKNILEKHLDSHTFEESVPVKVAPLTRPRFARDPSEYKRETFEEKLERLHPVSQYGHGGMPGFQRVMADRIMEDHLEEIKRKNFTELAEQ